MDSLKCTSMRRNLRKCRSQRCRLSLSSSSGSICNMPHDSLGVVCSCRPRPPEVPLRFPSAAGSLAPARGSAFSKPWMMCPTSVLIIKMAT
ncbi:hypothetical protein BJX63DRAFT_414810 [Aspergillus granulosus]|uniref:SRCR domain-containing protein n=1 Tax=Aspergillus granulosus TaxID=176169 RepID=A0ABR4GVL4_9EURO